MRISLSTLSSRQETVLEALKRQENISVSHQGRVVAVLRPSVANADQERMMQTPAFGMWADRDDMADPNQWRRSRRQKRRDRRSEGSTT
jgi:antitoxin (DNA-binding transcriptional repressor) of toxin-antitoxin stability system